VVNFYGASFFIGEQMDEVIIQPELEKNPYGEAYGEYLDNVKVFVLGTLSEEAVKKHGLDEGMLVKEEEEVYKKLKEEKFNPQFIDVIKVAMAFQIELQMLEFQQMRQMQEAVNGRIIIPGRGN
jgi:hypothetical protein